MGSLSNRSGVRVGEQWCQLLRSGRRLYLTTARRFSASLIADMFLNAPRVRTPGAGESGTLA